MISSRAVLPQHPKRASSKSYFDEVSAGALTDVSVAHSYEVGIAGRAAAVAWRNRTRVSGRHQSKVGLSGLGQLPVLVTRARGTGNKTPVSPPARFWQCE